MADANTTSRTGRLDLLIKDGFGLIFERFGVRHHAQPVIDEWVDENVREKQIPVTPSEIARRLGILGKKRDV